MLEHDSQCSRLLEIITRLRGKNGCPWDIKQTPESIKKYLLEESRELAEAIDSGDEDHIREELGDLFFIFAMLCTLYQEKGCFTLQDVCNDICEKMIRRHPHVFSNTPVGSLKEMEEQWEAIKQEEKRK